MSRSENFSPARGCHRAALTLLLAVLIVQARAADEDTSPVASGDPPGAAWLRDYLRAEVGELAARNDLRRIRSAEEWNETRERLRGELREMLGLVPEPPRGDLHVTVTGRIDHPEFTVEKLHYQSVPGLYVTANLYLPKNLNAPAPAILYACGHGQVKKNGISYGNKATYQHHPAWFARHGYVCLIIDTLQLGEIEGRHHGTHKARDWDWPGRGYTPAGIEAWNCIRALDLLESRAEVDRERIGMTGRSGGGIYSWWTLGLDDRVKVAVPVAGITDLENHILDDCIEGHCDCNYLINTYRWDYPMLAALAAPRPLLLANSDKDRIFPLSGVMRVHDQVRHIYDLLGAKDNFGVCITEGPHKDTQQLRIPAFHWFNKHLKGEEPLIGDPAEKLFEPEELKVFADLPPDELNTTIDLTFAPAGGEPTVPRDAAEWRAMRETWMTALRSKAFAGWPASPGEPDPRETTSETIDGVKITRHDFVTQHGLRLPLILVRAEGARVRTLTLDTVNDQRWESETAFLSRHHAATLRAMTEDGKALAIFAPRGVGPTRWWGEDKSRNNQILRRFLVMGQTLPGMQTWDVRRAISAVRSLAETKDAALTLSGDTTMAARVLLASLFEPEIAEVRLFSPTTNSVFLRFERDLGLAESFAMAAERAPLRVQSADPLPLDFAREVIGVLGLPPERLRVTAPIPSF